MCVYLHVAVAICMHACSYVAVLIYSYILNSSLYVAN